MKIIVCIKEVVDPALSLDFGLSNRVVFREGLPLRLNPNDAAALAMALGLKSPDEGTQVEITLISIGPERVESYLKNGLALGADKAVRIWSEDFTKLSSHQKARLLTGAVSLSGADLVLTGTRSLDTANGQVGPLIAAWLGLPCTGDVISIELDEEQKSINLTRAIGRGEREKLQCPLPAVITVKGEEKLPYASLDSLIESKSGEVMLLTPADLGISGEELLNDPTGVTDLIYPRPRPRKVPPLDSSLLAFNRILQLLEGGISKRKGTMLKGSSEELAERLFELLKEEGVIRPATGP
ncbi:MAG: electron transfer flavoprotein subunit beta/FixA family protein [Dehalococcoidales bacterium]|nr:electron transfer flavoprotein subunit beta/FixA family protein [Dehalococcoidales bacterium]